MRLYNSCRDNQTLEIFNISVGRNLCELNLILKKTTYKKIAYSSGSVPVWY